MKNLFEIKNLGLTFPKQNDLNRDTIISIIVITILSLSIFLVDSGTLYLFEKIIK